jgi:hypothetical protein
VIFAAVAVPWHWLAAERAGDLFSSTYIQAHTIERLRSNLIDSPRTDDPLYYPKHLGRTAWPALPLLLWGLLRLRRTWRPRSDPAGLLDRTLLVYGVAQVGMLAVVASRSARYLLPIYPVLALLAARGLAHGAGERAAARLRRWSAAGLAVAVVAIAVWPAPVGTPRGRPFRSLQRAMERRPADAIVEVDPALRDAWFDRAFWFYMGRSPREEGDPSAPATASTERLRVVPVERTVSCEPPTCVVLERTRTLALTAVGAGGRLLPAPSP